MAILPPERKKAPPPWGKRSMSLFFYDLEAVIFRVTGSLVAVHPLDDLYVKPAPFKSVMPSTIFPFMSSSSL